MTRKTKSQLNAFMGFTANTFWKWLSGDRHRWKENFDINQRPESIHSLCEQTYDLYYDPYSYRGHVGT